MASGVLLWDIIGRDKASPALLRIAAASDKAAAGASRATASLARLNAASERTRVVGARLTRHLTLPLLAIGALSVKAATDFHAAMTRISTQAGGTAKDVQALTKQVLDLAKYAQQGPTELANSLYHLKSVGLDNVSAMKALRQASDLAAVGHANLEETTNALAGAWRTGIKGAMNFHQAVATVNAIIGAGNMTLEDFNAALGTGILPTAKTFGLTLKDVGSALALFTDEGVPADAAATRLRMTFSLLGAPSKIAEKQLRSIGLTGLQLADDMRKPNGLIAAIGDLKDHVEDPKYHLSLSQQAQLLSHAFGGGRSSSAILSLINNFDVLKKKQDQVTKSMGKFDQAVSTQRKTPAAQFKLLESSLQRAAILLGDQLLPALIPVVKDIGNLAEKFNGLSTGTKKFVVEAGLGLLVLGPLLSLVGRLGRGIALMWAAGKGAAAFVAGTRAATLATETMTSSSYLAGRRIRGLSAGVRGLGGAMAGVSAGVIAGSLAGGGTGGWLTSIFGGAAGGAAFGAVGGGIGAVTGAIAGGLSGAITHLISQGSDEVSSSQAVQAAAVQAYQEAQAAAAGFASELDSVNGKLGLQARIFVSNKLTQSGAGELLAGLGFDLSKVSTALLRGGPALRAVNMQVEHLAQNGTITATQYKLLTDELGKAAAAGAEGAKQYNIQNQFLGKNLDLHKSIAQLLKKTHSTALPDIYRPQLDTAGAESNAEFFREKFQQIARQADKLFSRGGKSALEARQWFQDRVGDLEKMAGKAGFSRQLLGQIAAQFQSFPKKVQTEIRLEQHNAIQRLNDILTLIRVLKGNHLAGFDINTAAGRHHLAELNALAKHILDGVLPKLGINDAPARNIIDNLIGYIQNASPTIHVGVQTDPLPPGPIGVPGSPLDPHPRRHARGGSVADGWFTVGEEGGPRGWELGHKSGSKVTFLSNRDSRKMTGLDRLPGYAAGTKSVDSLRTRISNIGQVPGPQFQVSEVGIRRIAAQLRGAQIALDGAKLGPKAKHTLQEQLTRLQHLAFRQLKDLRIHIRHSDLAALKAATRGTVADVRTAGATLIHDLRLAGASAQQIAAVQRRQGVLVADQRKLLHEQARQAKVNDYSNGIKSTLTGAFDPTGFGSVGDLIAGLGGQTGQNNAYAGELSGLRKRAHGNKRLLAFFSQLAESGQTATLQTLAGSSSAGLAQVSKSLGAYNRSIASGADAATQTKYGTTQSAERARVEHDRAVVLQAVHAVGAMARAFTHQKATITIGGHAMEAVITHQVDAQFEAHLNELESLTRHGRS